MSRPSPGSEAPSIACLVFDIGPDTCMDCAVNTRVQHVHREIIEDLVVMFQVHFQCNDSSGIRSDSFPWHVFGSWRRRFMHI